ncbi:unnamed protein product [Mytilus edulis]|uniref:Uncharacterized protein n=1 Tax=Mytilus edulis TaxID=6550 RepID=A0A8S3QVJ9_MYTED|nr:unnamed protein product [Mytilus edulis]
MAEKELMTDMQKMAGMSTEEYESLNFYKYLCSKIGSEEVVKIRRLTTTMIDMGQTDIFKNITSGSKGEGLYFKSSDFDLMGIDPFFKKYTDEKFYTVLTTTEDTLNHFQKQELNLMKKEKLYTIYKTLTIFPLQFYDKSSIIPQELRVDVDVTNNHATYHPIGFAYFLSFLCYYHGQDITSCRHFLQLLKSTVTYPSLQADIIFTCSPLFCGIAHQLLGETNFARQMFQLCAMFDPYNLTSAASRLQGLHTVDKITPKKVSVGCEASVQGGFTGVYYIESPEGLLRRGENAGVPSGQTVCTT